MHKNKSNDNILQTLPKLKQFEESTLKDQYKVSTCIGFGSFGRVYEIKDTGSNDMGPLVVKSSEMAPMLFNEI